ncbi:MAG: hypothetical protein AAGK23_09570 [Pseudomonadota bacterium]
MTRVFLISGLAFAIICPAAQAEIRGGWSFKTDIKRKGCTITGNMSVSAENNDGLRTCSFVSEERCEIEPDISWKVEQTCRITPQGTRFIIRSQVIQSLTPGYSADSYLPDHFVVSPDGPNTMRGLWQDKNYAAPVIFWRDESLPIS